MENVLRAEARFLEAFHARGYGNVNEYYELLVIPMVHWGFNLGWLDFESNDPYNSEELEFKMESIFIGDEDPVECHVISVNRPPATDYVI
jgi:hypothetical protein